MHGEKGRDYKLEEVIANFKKLDEHLQDYVLKQVRLALEYQAQRRHGEAVLNRVCGCAGAPIMAPVCQQMREGAYRLRYEA